MRLIFLALLSACFEKKPQSDEDCVTFRDKCNAGCELICGSVYEEEKVDNSCDLGCSPDEDTAIPDCILIGEECQFSE